MNHLDLQLIKDFDADTQRIVLYWTDCNHRKVSSDFTSVGDAHIWWIGFQNSLYDGVDRRDSNLDRRWLISQRVQQSNGLIRHSDAPDGRRYTDRPIHVDRDVSRVHLLQYYARNPELYERDQLIPDARQAAFERWGVKV